MQEATIALKDPENTRWFYRPFWVWILILSFGPLAIPFLLLSPCFSKKSKWIIGGILIFLTAWFSYVFYEAYQRAHLILTDPTAMEAFIQELEQYPFFTEEHKQALRWILTGEF